MRKVVILTHQGLGDMIICHGLVRYLASKGNLVILPCKTEHLSSVTWMFKGISVVPVPCKNDDEVEYMANCMAVVGASVLKLGVFSGNHSKKDWDSEFYRTAGINSDLSWNNFSVSEPPFQVTTPETPYSFVHQDNSRNFSLSWEHSPSGNFVSPDITLTNNIFCYLGALRNASEIHVIDSCFLCLADRVETTGKLVFHRYAKPNPNPPQLKKDWIIL